MQQLSPSPTHDPLHVYGRWRGVLDFPERCPLDAPPLHILHDAPLYDAPIPHARPLRLGLRVRLYSVVERKSPLLNHFLGRRRIYDAVDMGVEGSLTAIVANSSEGVTFVLTNEVWNSASKHVAIRALNIPGFTVEISDDEARAAWQLAPVTTQLNLDLGAEIIDHGLWSTTPSTHYLTWTPLTRSVPGPLPAVTRPRQKYPPPQNNAMVPQRPLLSRFSAQSFRPPEGPGSTHLITPDALTSSYPLRQAKWDGVPWRR